MLAVSSNSVLGYPVIDGAIFRIAWTNDVTICPLIVF